MAGKLGRKIYKRAEWRRVRLAMLERAGWRCERCGKPGRLECHHKNPIAKGGDWFNPDNLEILCRPCHFAEPIPNPRARPKNEFDTYLEGLSNA